VVALEADRVRALKNVTANEPFFSGHFPGRAVMPGVLILEGMAQAAGVLHLHTYPEGVGYLVGVESARFRRMVVPGDQLVYEGTVQRQRPSYCKVAMRASVGGSLAAEAVIALATEGGP